MIILDTNVVSEGMKPEPDACVRNWLDSQAAETLFLTSITVAELKFGVAALPRGKRKDRLILAVDGLLDLFAGRILAFDVEAASRYAGIAVAARTAGRGFPTPDGYIAAIASARSFSVAPDKIHNAPVTCRGEAGDHGIGIDFQQGARAHR